MTDGKGIGPRTKTSGGGSVRLAEHFLYAGFSALLLAIPHFHPEMWFLSVFALIPFLWRVVRVGFWDSIMVGNLLAVSYCFVMVPFVSWVSLTDILTKLLIFTALFAAYAGAVNRISRHVGLNAIFIAVLWLPLEYALNHIAFIDQILAFPQESSGLITRVGTIFGMLIVSFVIVLTNILILILLKEVIDALVTGADLNIERVGRLYNSVVETPLADSQYNLASPRAPPLF